MHCASVTTRMWTHSSLWLSCIFILAECGSTVDRLTTTLDNRPIPELMPELSAVTKGLSSIRHAMHRTAFVRCLYPGIDVWSALRATKDAATREPQCQMALDEASSTAARTPTTSRRCLRPFPYKCPIAQGQTELLACTSQSQVVLENPP